MESDPPHDAAADGEGAEELEYEEEDVHQNDDGDHDADQEELQAPPEEASGQYAGDSVPPGPSEAPDGNGRQDGGGASDRPNGAAGASDSPPAFPDAMDVDAGPAGGVDVPPGEAPPEGTAATAAASAAAPPGAPGEGRRPSDRGGDRDGQGNEPVDPMSLPPDGAELFIGGIPHAATDDEIRVFCETIGHVHRLHVPVKDRREGYLNPGYAFVTYMSRVDAARAIEELSGKTMPKFPSLPLRVAYSDKRPKNKLYVANIPRHLDHGTLLTQLRELVPGVIDVDLCVSKDHSRGEVNRGFGFLEMYNNAAADAARTALTSPTLQLGGTTIAQPLEVQWADNKNVDPAEAAAVKSLYISNLPDEITEAKLRELFDHFAPSERIALLHQKDEPTKMRDYAFIHYPKRSVALQVLEECQKAPIVCDGRLLSVALAKPSGSSTGAGREFGGASHRGGPPLGPPMSRGPPGGPAGPRPPMRPAAPRDGYGGYRSGGYDDSYGPPPGRGPRQQFRGDPYGGPPPHGWEPGFDRPPGGPWGHGGYDDYDAGGGYGDDGYGGRSRYGAGGPERRGSGGYEDGPRRPRGMPMMMAPMYPGMVDYSSGSMMGMAPGPGRPGGGGAWGPGGGGGAPPRAGPATGGYGSGRPATAGYGSGGKAATGGYGSKAAAPTSTVAKGYGQQRYNPY